MNQSKARERRAEDLLDLELTKVGQEVGSNDVQHSS